MLSDTVCSTRPFLETIEKKWVIFQLLCSLRDCHSAGICHGDIKMENILVTSWNWIYLSDFSSSFKPVFLAEDNPADFSLFFDTSGRRTCYLAPERFLTANESPVGRSLTTLTKEMDLFSAGCVIAEIFTETPTFTLSQLYKYKKGEYDPIACVGKIEDDDIRSLVCHMIQLQPEARFSAEEYLTKWRRKAFPEYFYTFLHQYLGLFTTPSAPPSTSARRPSSMFTNHSDGNEANFSAMAQPDDWIEKIFLDFDKISYFLGDTTEKSVDGSALTSPTLISKVSQFQLDLPQKSNQSAESQPTPLLSSPSEDGTLIFLTLLVSCVRNTIRASARVKANDLLLAFAERVPDEAKLDRILPYVVLLLSDPSDIVKITAIRALTHLLSMVKVVSPINSYVFSEYIFPQLRYFIKDNDPTWQPNRFRPRVDPSPMVRTAYASCIASLAQSSLRILDMVQALRSDIRFQSLRTKGTEPTWKDDISLYDSARADLLVFFERHTKALVTDEDTTVRRAFLGSVSTLCVFFGETKANEVILSHLNTYLNDRDWDLKCAFLESVVQIAAYVGTANLEQFVLPLIVQSITDSEDSVADRALRSLTSMANLGLFTRPTVLDLLNTIIPFFAHPNIWLREAAVRFVVTSATASFSPADKVSILLPLIAPYMTINIVDASLTESDIFKYLKPPLSRNVYDMILSWAMKTERGVFWKSASRPRNQFLSSPSVVLPSPSSLSSFPRNEEDEQWINLLHGVGMTRDDETKFLALREYIFKNASLHRLEEKEGKSRAMISNGDSSDSIVSSPVQDFPDRPSDVIKLEDYGIMPQTRHLEKLEEIIWLNPEGDDSRLEQWAKKTLR